MSWIDALVKGRVAYKFDEKLQPYSKKKSYYLCPECGDVLTTHCLCPRMDALCHNKHQWHLEYDPATKKQYIRKGHSH